MSDWWWLMTPLMVACWALVIWVVTMLWRSNRRTAHASLGAENLLAERLARGEIDELEYRRRRKLIRS